MLVPLAGHRSNVPGVPKGLFRAHGMESEETDQDGRDRKWRLAAGGGAGSEVHIRAGGYQEWEGAVVSPG